MSNRTFFHGKSSFLSFNQQQQRPAACTTTAMDFSASYGSLKEAEAGLKAQAHALGFDLAVKERFPRGAAAEEVTRVNYRCAKGRSHVPKNDEAIHTTKRRKTSSQMTACGYKINLKRVPGAG